LRRGGAIKSIYVDTSVIVARYKPGDPLYNDSNALFQREYRFVVSPLVLVELYSVFSRIRPYIRLPKPLKGVALNSLVRFVIDDCKLTVMYNLLIARIREGACRVPLEYIYAMRLAEALRLRALDLLHVAQASLLNGEVEALVTGDEELLERRERIKELTGLSVASPRELI